METQILKKNNLYVWLFLFLSAVSFYLLDRYAIFSIDDWPYSWVSEADGNNYFSPLDEDAVRKHVDSIEDAVVSQSREYFRSNGRFLTHVLVQYLCGTVPMATFVILNSFVFLIFLYSMLCHSLQRPFRISEMLILLSSIWFLIPFKGMTFFGNIAMTVNYLWTATFTLLFLLLYFHLKKRQKTLPLFALAGVFVLSAIVGSLQESFCIGFAGAFFFMLIVEKRKKTLTKIDVAIAAGYIIGTAVCVFSPANFARAEGNGIGFHFNVIYGLAASPAFDVFVLTLLGLVLKRRSRILNFFKDNLLLSLAFLFNFLFALVIAYNGRHQLNCISILAVILMCKIWFEEFRLSVKVKNILAIVALSLTLVTAVPIYHLRKEYHAAYEELLENARHTDNGIVVAKTFIDLTAKIHNMPWIDNYYVSTFSFSGTDCWRKCISLMLTNGKDLYLVKQVLPEKPQILTDRCVPSNEVTPGVYMVNRRYIYKSDKEMPVEDVRMKVLRKPKAFFMKDVEDEIIPSDYFEWNGKWYYLFGGDIIKVRGLKILSL